MKCPPLAFYHKANSSPCGFNNQQCKHFAFWSRGVSEYAQSAHLKQDMTVLADSLHCWIVHPLGSHSSESVICKQETKKPKWIERTTSFILVIKSLKETMQKEHNYLLNKTYNMVFPVQPRQCLQLTLPTIELRNNLHLTKR